MEQAELQRLQSEIGTHQNRIQFNRQRAEELTEAIERSRKDIAAAEAKRTQQHKEIEQANVLLEKTNQLLQAKEAELTKLTDAITGLRAERAAREAELKTLDLALSKSESRMKELEDDLSGITIRRETTHENQRDLDSAISDANRRATKFKKKLPRRARLARQRRKNIDLLKTETHTREGTLQQRQQLLAEAEKSLTAIERALAKKNHDSKSCGS